MRVDPNLLLNGTLPNTFHLELPEPPLGLATLCAVVEGDSTEKDQLGPFVLSLDRVVWKAPARTGQTCVRQVQDRSDNGQSETHRFLAAQRIGIQQLAAIYHRH
ncbi:MAG: hypothetical protein IH881_11465 [Myxococcales bacterium]|nr:hypothetical protein [Myxococcales bacterium]